MSRTKGFSVLKKCIYKAYFTRTALVIPSNPHRRRQTSWLFKMVMKLMVRAGLQSSGHVALFNYIEGCAPIPPPLSPPVLSVCGRRIKTIM